MRPRRYFRVEDNVEAVEAQQRERLEIVDNGRPRGLAASMLLAVHHSMVTQPCYAHIIHTSPRPQQNVICEHFYVSNRHNLYFGFKDMTS